ncbi:MAG: hypothetical protein ACK4ZW_06015 [Blastomonas sp.]
MDDEKLARAVSEAFYGYDVIAEFPPRAYADDSRIGKVMKVIAAASPIIAREVAAETELCARLCEDRAAMYRRKAARTGFLDEDCMTLAESREDCALASEYAAAAIRGRAINAAMDAAGEGDMDDTEIEAAAQEIERLREALLFYAEPDRWDDYESDMLAAAHDRDIGSELGDDKGDQARKALGLAKLPRRYGTTDRLVKAGDA